jgi:hypothetical protein
MAGAPSQLDLFDYKPTLQKFDGEKCPQHLLEGKRFAFLRGHPSLLGTKFKFDKHGECGLEISENLPHLATVADDIAVVKTLHTEQINHGPAQVMFHTGFGRFGRPSIGSWVSYGLGSENRDLPAYVVMVTGKVAGGGNSLWGSGFLPSVYQGVEFRSEGDPVLFLSNPPGVTRDDRRRLLDGFRPLSVHWLTSATRIVTAFAVRNGLTAGQRPRLMELADERLETIEMYAKPGQASFANNCLLARRLVVAASALSSSTTPIGIITAARNESACPHQRGRSANGGPGRTSAARPSE